jgi:hypothetical protein
MRRRIIAAIVAVAAIGGSAWGITAAQATPQTFHWGAPADPGVYHWG